MCNTILRGFDLFECSRGTRGTLKIAAAVLAVLVLAVTVQAITIGPETKLGPGRLSSIWLDKLGQPHVACDGGTWLYLYDKIGDTWNNNSTNFGLVGASQFYNPHNEIDWTNDTQWISGCVFGTQIGAGTVVRKRVSSNPSKCGYTVRKFQGAWEQGNLSLNWKEQGRAVWYSASGKWIKLQNGAGTSTSVIEGGQMFAGLGGEKNVFWISKSFNPVWHGAVGGYNRWDSSYQNSVRNSKGLGTVKWAAYSAYPSQGDDMCYVSCVSDVRKPQWAYIACDFGPGKGVCMNIWKPGGMVYPITKLLTVDANGTSGLRRFAPQMSPCPTGGVFIAWTRSNYVYVKHVSPQFVNTSPALQMGPGTMASLYAEPNAIHLAYYNGGYICYRRLLLN